MKKPIAVLLAVVVTFLAGRFSIVFDVEAQEGGDDPIPYCADANSDGDVNIVDAVYILNFLFAGGAKPECARQESTALPATGQTICYDANGNEMECDDAVCPGQDGFYQAGCASAGRFVDNLDGTVTDTCTGLLWTQVIANGQARFDWCSALEYCEELDVAGHDDWRLPNIRELLSLVHYGNRVDEPMQDPAFNPRVVGAGTWSSTSLTNRDPFRPDKAWMIWFGKGALDRHSKLDEFMIQAVRAIRPGE